MKKIRLSNFITAALLSCMAGSADAQIPGIQDLTSEQCSALARDQVANATRTSIEMSVARAGLFDPTELTQDEILAMAESGAFGPNPDSCFLVDIYGPFGKSGGYSPRTTGSGVARDVSDWLAGINPVVQSGGIKLVKHISDQQQKFSGFKDSPRATTDWGLLLDYSTVDLDNDEMDELSGVIIRNTLAATPYRAPTDEERMTPGGLDHFAYMEQKNARLQAASESIEMVLNMRTPVMKGDAVETYRKMAADSAYSGSGRVIGDTLSELQQIEIQTIWNYAPAGERLKTLTNTGGMNEKAWLYEIHRMLSLMARIRYLELELASRDAVVNAAILASLANKP